MLDRCNLVPSGFVERATRKRIMVDPRVTFLLRADELWRGL